MKRVYSWHVDCDKLEKNNNDYKNKKKINCESDCLFSEKIET